MKYIIAIALGFALLTFASGCISFNASGGSIKLNDPVVAKGADEQNHPIEPTSEFKSTDKRMYVILSAEAPPGTHIGYRWYYGDKLIIDDRIGLDSQGRAAIFLESPPGGSFPIGDYRVEIYLVKTADRIVNFKVTK